MGFLFLKSHRRVVESELPVTMKEESSATATAETSPECPLSLWISFPEDFSHTRAVSSLEPVMSILLDRATPSTLSASFFGVGVSFIWLHTIVCISKTIYLTVYDIILRKEFCDFQ